MKKEDLKIIEKVYKNYNQYDWDYLTPASNYYSVLHFPEKIESVGELYYATIIPGLIIVTGNYLVRFYHEEDDYVFEREYFVSILSESTHKVANIAFITEQDYEDSLKPNKNEVLRSPAIDLAAIFGSKPANIVSELYDSVNRIVNDVNRLYDEFLDIDTDN